MYKYLAMAPSFEGRSLAWRVRFRTRSGRNISLSFQDHSDAVNFESDVTANPWQCYFVLCSTTLYYAVLVCTTQYYLVIRSTSLYYPVLACTTQHYFVLRDATLYYAVHMTEFVHRMCTCVSIKQSRLLNASAYV